MGNEAAVKCNRSRAAMAASVALAFEERVAKLHTILDLNADVEDELSEDVEAAVSPPPTTIVVFI
eukprot:422548-Pyramimonas_sp.AAC.1